MRRDAGDDEHRARVDDERLHVRRRFEVPHPKRGQAAENDDEGERRDGDDSRPRSHSHTVTTPRPR
ncbi:hypothetical protein C441_02542 [Haloferax sulfurifontis ATCC BAA-897]|uniref:Uncharacterized protein n=1 Tax=Haloferax sulfurifontis ATCC BAA-897 TaxID=662480 RepID=M0IPA7_9EURY|nr:hypothetical protein C441_02542 [Haloferax sulfurifontis ATCC BAA-897]